MKHKFQLKQPIKILWLLLLPFMLAGCKKWDGEGKTTVEGQAIDRYTSEPVPYATIIIRSQPGNSSYGFNTKVEEKQADANGKFDFSFEAESDKNYAVSGGLEERYFSGVDGMETIKGARKNKDIKLKMYPFAWAKIKVINEPPLDTAWMHITGTFFHHVGGYPGFNLNMLYKDTIVIRPMDGNVTSSMYWRINKTGTWVEHRQDQYFPPLDTTEFIIRY